LLNLQRKKCSNDNKLAHIIMQLRPKWRKSFREVHLTDMV